LSYLALGSSETIYYECIIGDGSKPYLVFLHEGLGCTGMWGDFPARLCERTGCPGLLYDRTGYGRSSQLSAERTIHYMHRYALQELPEVLAKSIPGKTYILIGHSDGGSIGLIHGSERPSLLRGVITEAAHVFVEPESLTGVRRADNAFAQGKFGGLHKYHGEKTEQIFKAWSQTWLSEWFLSWNIEYLLPSICCPLLVLQGTEDQYGTERQVEAIVAGAVGETKLCMVEGCGHTPHLERQEAVLARMAEFVLRVGEA